MIRKGVTIFLVLFVFFNFSFAKAETLDLKAGWNMISISEGILPVRKLIQDNPQCKFKTPAYWYNPKLKKYETPENIEPIKGYWIYLDSSCKSVIKPYLNVDYPTSLNLSYGWNMISPHKFEFSFIQFSNNCSTQYPLYWYDPSQGQYLIFNKKDLLSPKRGYWIYYSGSRDCKIQSGENNYKIKQQGVNVYHRILIDKQTGFSGILGRGNTLYTEVLTTFDRKLFDTQRSKFEIYDLSGTRLAKIPFKLVSSYLTPIDMELRFYAQWDSKGKASGTYIAVTTLCNKDIPNCKVIRDKFVILPYLPSFSQKLHLNIERVGGDGSKIKFTLWETLGSNTTIKECKLTIIDEDEITNEINVSSKKGTKFITKDFNKAGVYFAVYKCKIEENSYGAQYETEVYSDPKMFYVDFLRKYQPNDIYEIVFVPLNWSSQEDNEFKNSAERAFKLLTSKEPIKEIPKEKIKYYTLEPKDCKDKVTGDLPALKPLSIVYNCVLHSPYKDRFEVAVGICKNDDCLGEEASSKVLGIGAIPDDNPNYTFNSATAGMTSVAVNDPEVILHEMGHNFGLYHINRSMLDYHCPAPGACLGPNKLDCDQDPQIKKSFIMDYCPPMERFGPSAQKYLREHYFKFFLR